jgi:formamidopyrimidine-DNA glycosylase
MEASEFKEKLRGQKILDLSRRGKYLIFHLEDYYLLSHLRMEGKYFDRMSGKLPGKHVHVIFKFTNGEELWYDDVRKFGSFHLYDKTTDLEATPSFRVLGVEPFSSILTADYLEEKLLGKKKPIKSLLLDQSVFTGLGNIYVDEVLYRGKIHPQTQSSKLSKKELEDVVKYTQEILNRAIELKGTTIKTFSSEHGVSGLFQNELRVHTRKGEPCPACGSPIVKTKVGGRGTYFCPQCQKEKI